MKKIEEPKHRRQQKINNLLFGFLQYRDILRGGLKLCHALRVMAWRWNGSTPSRDFIS